MKRIAVNFRLEAELLELLKTTAKSKNLSKTAMLEECLKSVLFSPSDTDGSQETSTKVSNKAKDIQALVDATVEQKVKAHFQEIEKAISQIQNDLAKLRHSSSSK
jgi:hypothetical protein